MYAVELSQHAQKFLDKIDTNLKGRIEKTLKRLEFNPVPGDAKFLGRQNNEKVFRYRIGSYRALYVIDEKNKLILVTKIDKRAKIYD